MGERLLAALVALLEALKPLFSTLGAFLAGKGVAEYRAMETALEQERKARELEQDLLAFHDGLSDGELRDITAKRIAAIRLRLKARAADRSGGHDD